MTPLKPLTIMLIIIFIILSIIGSALIMLLACLTAIDEKYCTEYDQDERLNEEGEFIFLAN